MLSPRSRFGRAQGVAASAEGDRIFIALLISIGGGAVVGLVESACAGVEGE